MKKPKVFLKPVIKTLMIVDDDLDDHFFFQKAVKALSGPFALMKAFNGEEALEKLKHAETLPDYIFLDINMPIMNGIECLRELKKNENLKNIPVIMYTTSKSPDDMRRTAELGACHFLNKAIDIIHLPQEIEKAIGKADQFNSSKRPPARS